MSTTLHFAPKSSEIHELNELAVRGLVSMFDPEQELFCFRLRRSQEGTVREGISHRYTIMTLLGLWKYEKTGPKSPIPIQETLERLLRRTDWLGNIGDLGLLLWVCALAAPDRLEETCRTLQLSTALSQYREVRERRTMELAWFVTGLSHAALVNASKKNELKEIAAQTYRLLKKNHGPHGFFGHLGKGGSLQGMIRGSIGSFADQVYPIYGLTKFAEAFEVEEALQEAMDCAVAICKAQGPLGQWWWHYDATTGRVAQRYPVYSVHQHGMGPMALLALAEASKLDFSDAINKGLRWIAGENELQTSMQDEALSIIWRSVQPASKLKMYANEMLEFFRLRVDSATPDGLTILYECRPYELGWLLYAFSEERNRNNVH